MARLWTDRSFANIDPLINFIDRSRNDINYNQKAAELVSGSMQWHWEFLSTLLNSNTPLRIAAHKPPNEESGRNIWKNHNNYIFYNSFSTCSDIISLSTHLYYDILAANNSLDDCCQPCISKSTVLISWNPPPINWIKVNMDGAMKRSMTGAAFSGGLLRILWVILLLVSLETLEYAVYWMQKFGASMVDSLLLGREVLNR